MDQNKTPEKLEKSRIQIIYKEFFYGSMLHGMPTVMREEEGFTMATDGRSLFCGRKWVEDHSVEEIKGVLIHEIMHKIYRHHLRIGELMKAAPDDQTKAKVHKKWNMATDYVINQQVLDEGFKLPKDGLIDTKWRGHSSEQVYAKLPDDPEQDGGGGPSWGEVMDGTEGMSQEEIEQAHDEIETEVRQAAEAAKTRGKLPAHIEAMIKEWDEAKIDWKARLWKSCDTHGNAWEDVSWERPNRRYIQQGMYLPTPVEFGPGPVVTCFDASGSVSKEEFTACVGEVDGIMQDTKPEYVRIMQCDTEICSDITLDPSFEEFPKDYKRERCGGTSFHPPFKRLAKEGVTPQYMIYLTDGHADFPPEPDYPVIWVITTDVVAPYGETIHLRLN